MYYFSNMSSGHQVLVLALSLIYGVTFSSAQNIVTPSSATSTTTIGSNGRLIGTTIDGSGLSSGGSSSDVTTETHSPNNANNALYWLSASTSMGGTTTSPTEVLVFSFDAPANIDTIHHWVYTRVGQQGRGIKTFDISFSTDNGVSYPVTIAAATLGDFTLAPVLDNLPQTKSIALQIGVTHVRIDNITTFSSTSYVGMSEIRFAGPPVTHGLMFRIH